MASHVKRLRMAMDEPGVFKHHSSKRLRLEAEQQHKRHPTAVAVGVSKAVRLAKAQRKELTKAPSSPLRDVDLDDGDIAPKPPQQLDNRGRVEAVRKAVLEAEEKKDGRSSSDIQPAGRLEHVRTQTALVQFRRMVASYELHDREVAARAGARELNKPAIFGRVYTWMKELGWLPYPDNRIGAIPGVDIGARFYNHGEMAVSGIFRQFRGGIESKVVANGVSVATALVMAGEYNNRELDSEGRIEFIGAGPVNKDQELKRGNKALRNAMKMRSPVR
eukprot:jgi/Chlat1/5762/Chrsp387S05494